MSENDPYVLSEAKGRGREVVIMDKDTGVEQVSMHWSHGLHQFLQLKHMDKVGSESLKAVFISNLSYFKRWEGTIYGITGTLGSEAERDLLSKCYDVDFFRLPRFKARKCTVEDGKICRSETEWLESIQRTVKAKTQTENISVLIIAENVDSVDKIVGALEGEGCESLYAYKSSFDKEFQRKFAAHPLVPGTVIVATNLAGRGTDLKISDELSSAGGLHVILTYMPSNIRVEEQAFGRTARIGQPGSTQFIFREVSVW
jgi:preprotein translocase subunit SecA